MLRTTVYSNGKMLQARRAVDWLDHVRLPVEGEMINDEEGNAFTVRAVEFELAGTAVIRLEDRWTDLLDDQPGIDEWMAENMPGWSL